MIAPHAMNARANISPKVFSGRPRMSISGCIGRRGDWCAVVTVIALCQLCPAASAAAPLDTTVELSPRFARILYVHPHRLVDNVAPTGANGYNASWEAGTAPRSFIEEQRHGEEAVMAGIAMERPDVGRMGVRLVGWGFAPQKVGGNFAADFHSTSFFIEATAHLILVLRGAAAAGRPLPRGLLRHMEAHLPALRFGARWMARKDIFDEGYAIDTGYAHRRFLVAGAFGLTGMLTHD